MDRRNLLVLGGAALLSGCVGGGGAPQVQLGPDGRPLARVYRITPADQAAIPFRVLDSVNSLRRARALPPVALEPRLTAAAETHARDMSVQNRPWHFGSDGSSPLVRVQRVGYQGRLVGELISETYQTELETLSAWMTQPDTRDVIMDPSATEIGFGWFQESNGKIWWTLVTGASGRVAVPLAGQGGVPGGIPGGTTLPPPAPVTPVTPGAPVQGVVIGGLPRA
jgi:hypothetical protein